MSRHRNKYAVELVSVATGGDSAAIGRIDRCQPAGEKDIRSVLYDHDVPQAEVVKEDTHRVLCGKPPRYFARYRRLERQFRRRLGIPEYTEHPAIDHSNGLVDTSDILDEILEDLRSDEPKDPYKMHGIACRHEKSTFYDSPEWERRAKAIRAMDQFTCRSCGRSNVELHVHHLHPIHSVYGKKFYQNFDVVRMRTLCKSCHMDLHEGAIRGVKMFKTATDEEQEKHKKRRKREREMHDEVRECLWCQRFVWDTEPEWLDEIEACTHE